MRKARFVGLAAVCLFAGGNASVQEWPTRTLTIINPFGAGAPNDVPARLFA
jgi:tripartite-type tricarboxylate transporter receptor subunit TctC